MPLPTPDHCPNRTELQYPMSGGLKLSSVPTACAAARIAVRGLVLTSAPPANARRPRRETPSIICDLDDCLRHAESAARIGLHEEATEITLGQGGRAQHCTHLPNWRRPDSRSASRIGR